MTFSCLVFHWIGECHHCEPALGIKSWELHGVFL